ncbi:unnamed protein product [Spirodela intermedia]|uniref:Uncharacterized protein n=1 Tax=Spirodela intermedia TaxID=51605 RepID=A0ABN7EA34_SPIIN|nr:unnamed protein product [Spirodela intermedia]
MGRRVVSGGYHPAEQKNGDFAALCGCHLMKRGWMEVGRWRLVSRQIVLFPTTACSSINRR